MPLVLTLAGTRLTAEILDPARELSMLGSRYCSGGYVWQVTDDEHGAAAFGSVLSGSDAAPVRRPGAPGGVRDRPRPGHGEGRRRRLGDRRRPRAARKPGASLSRARQPDGRRARVLCASSARASASRCARAKRSRVSSSSSCARSGSTGARSPRATLASEPRRARHSGALVRAPVLSVGGRGVLSRVARDRRSRTIPDFSMNDQGAVERRPEHAWDGGLLRRSTHRARRRARGERSATGARCRRA